MMTINWEQYSLDHDWYESVYDDATAIGKIIGIDIDDISFTGFCSQGDGASFTGNYSYAKGAAKAIRQYAPLDTKLHRIADVLQDIQRRHFYQLTASISRSSHRYSHEMTMSVDVETDRDISLTRVLPDGRKMMSDKDSLIDALRDVARWIYRTLEKEYEYQQAWQMANHWQELETEAKVEKETARELIRDMRKARRDDVPASICAVLRATGRRHLESAVSALDMRTEIADEFGYWEDGKRVGVAEFAAVHL